jgi:hypothetical protein
MNSNLRYRRQVVAQKAIADRLARKKARQARQTRRQARGYTGRRLAVIALSLITGISADPSHPFGVLIAGGCLVLALFTIGVAER